MSGAPHRRQVLVATRNPGKLRELRPLLAAAGWEPIGLEEAGVAEDLVAEELIESFDSFEANALAKARHFAALAGGRPVLADDSGLAVAALGGAPGVRSKRWSGRTDLAGAELDSANNAKLLAVLRDHGDRRAAYECAAAWLDDRGALVRTGRVEGRIVDTASGAQGFGYDPYFVSDELGRTFGESSREEKARISHRGRAIRALLAALAERDGMEGRGRATDLAPGIDSTGRSF